MKSRTDRNSVVEQRRPFRYRAFMNMTMPPGRGTAEMEMSRAFDAAERSVSIVAVHDWSGRFAMALLDLRQTMQLWRLVWTLSLLDIRLRYRGSILGPFWLTLSTAVMIAALGFLYSRLFHTDIKTYLPFLSLSLVLWTFLQTLTGDGCTCFTSSEAMIRAARMPLSLHAARVVVRNILVLSHNVVVIVAVFLIMGTVPGPYSFTIVPAFALWVVDAMAISLMLGVLCARFRDIPPIVASIMQIAFFVSPVIWSPTILAHRGIGIVLVKWNPFYALLEIMRGPLLGTKLELGNWAIALGYSAILVVLAAVSFARARSRIAYWV
jgi:lipopolysaccharide transport system permease protein